MPTDTRTSELVLNVLSKQDYDNIPNPDPNQLYLVPEDEELDPHRCIEFQIPTVENNYTWYRKYADGWVEQGTKLEGLSNSGSVFFNFPVTMKDTNYTITGSIYANADNININIIPYIREYYTGKVGVKISSSTPTYNLYYFIEVRGIYATE